MAQMRELRTLEEAVSLLDEWVSAYDELEREAMRLDRAWALKYRELEYEMHRLQGLEYDLIYQRALEDRANALAAECPF